MAYPLDLQGAVSIFRQDFFNVGLHSRNLFSGTKKTDSEKIVEFIPSLEEGNHDPPHCRE